MDRRRLRAGIVAFAAFVAALLALIAAWPTIEQAFAPPGPPPSWVNGTLETGPRVGHHLANPFYAVVFTAANKSGASLRVLGSYLNTTPISWFRYGGAGEGYDATTQTVYAPPPGGGRFVATPMQLWNLTWFKTWCLSRTPHCDWMGYLPAELNLTQAAVHTADWYHSVLGLSPGLWQLGNEPEAWTHYGENYTEWSTLDSSAPTPAAYATMVHNYISAVAARYPTDEFVGVEASCATCNPSLISDTATVNGPTLSAMAFHSYPALSGSSSSLVPFYGALASPGNISSTVNQFSQLVGPACGPCAGLPLQIGEYQAGPHGATSPFASGVPGAIFLAASVIEALRANVSMLTLFDTGALINASTGVVSPEGRLYQTVLANLTMGDDFAASVVGDGVSGTYSIIIQNGTRQSLLVVDTSLTTGLNLTVSPSAFPLGGTGSAWSWNAGSPGPTFTSYSSTPGLFRVPPQGLLLVNNF